MLDSVGNLPRPSHFLAELCCYGYPLRAHWQAQQLRYHIRFHQSSPLKLKAVENVLVPHQCSCIQPTPAVQPIRQRRDDTPMVSCSFCGQSFAMRVASLESGSTIHPPERMKENACP